VSVLGNTAAVFSQALEGVLVVSVEQAVAAPYCTQKLQEAGARVIKVERPEGDFARGYDRTAAGESAYFVWLNRGKESICLDLRQGEDAAMLHRLIADADVFVQNLAPMALDRLGFSSKALRAQYPRLITVDISGYGDAPAVARLKAYDLLVQCESGLASITGSAEAPGRVGVSVCDIACGLTCFAAVLQALIARGRTGHGCAIAVSLFDVIAEWMAVPLMQLAGGLESKRAGLHHPTIAPYGAYAAGDGKQVVFSIQNLREWQRLCAVVLGQPDLATDPRFADNQARVHNRQLLDTELNGVFARLSQTELCARLAAADLAYGAVNSLSELRHHAALRTERQPLANGAVDLVAGPVRIDGVAHPRTAPVPGTGAQGADIRQEWSARTPG
jgi:itaconate CoA-transferase